jgi:hypothetical protein
VLRFCEWARWKDLVNALDGRDQEHAGRFSETPHFSEGPSL